MTGLSALAVVGCQGFLGRNFLSTLRKDFPETLGVSRPELDLNHPEQGATQLAKRGCKTAILVGGLTGVARCETNVAATRKVNVVGTIALIRQLKDFGIKPVFFSSDYVFDGTTGGYSDGAQRNPTTEYGKQKQAVEDAIEELCAGNYLALRLSKVFSLEPGQDSFLSEVARDLVDGKQVQAAYDQIFCPTLVDDVIRITLRLIHEGVSGTLNLCSPEPWSRRDLIAGLASRLKAEPSLVVSAPLSAIDDSRVDRPKNTSMVPGKLKALGACEFTSVEVCLDRFTQLWTKLSASEWKTT